MTAGALCVFVLAVLSSGCPGGKPSVHEGKPPADPPPQSAAMAWRATALLQVDPNLKLQSVAIGDLAPDIPGNEIATFSESGKGFILHRKGEEWAAEEVVDGNGKMTGILIADADPSIPGNELYGGGVGFLYRIHREAGAWVGRKVWTGPDYVHAIAIGDLDVSREGRELAIVDYGFKARILRRDNEAWIDEVVFADTGQLKCVLVGDFMPEAPGDEILVGGRSKNLTLIYREGETWRAKTLWTADSGIARMDFLPVTEGILPKVVMGCDSGKVVMLWHENSEWKTRQVFDDQEGIRGVAAGDFDPGSPGAEVAIFGYTKTVSILSPGDGAWSAKVVWTDTERGHWLTAGELDGSNKTAEIVSVGYSGKLVLLTLK